MRSTARSGSPPALGARQAPGAAARLAPACALARRALPDPAVVLALLTALVLALQTLALRGPETARLSAPPPPLVCAPAAHGVDGNAVWWATPPCVVYDARRPAAPARAT